MANTQQPVIRMFPNHQPAAPVQPVVEEVKAEVVAETPVKAKKKAKE